MLKEKVEALRGLYKSLMHAHESVETINEVHDEIKRACKNLKAAIDSNCLTTVDAEIQTAISTAYQILETAKVGLENESVNLLDNPKNY